jgi:hypothetical protein
MGTFHSVCGSPSTRGAEDARSNAFPIPYTVWRHNFHEAVELPHMEVRLPGACRERILQRLYVSI